MLELTQAFIVRHRVAWARALAFVAATVASAYLWVAALPVTIVLVDDVKSLTTAAVLVTYRTVTNNQPQRAVVYDPFLVAERGDLLLLDRGRSKEVCGSTNCMVVSAAWPVAYVPTASALSFAQQLVDPRGHSPLILALAMLVGAIFSRWVLLLLGALGFAIAAWIGAQLGQGLLGDAGYLPGWLGLSSVLMSCALSALCAVLWVLAPPREGMVLVAIAAAVLPTAVVALLGLAAGPHIIIAVIVGLMASLPGWHSLAPLMVAAGLLLIALGLGTSWAGLLLLLCFGAVGFVVRGFGGRRRGHAAAGPNGRVPSSAFLSREPA